MCYPLSREGPGLGAEPDEEAPAGGGGYRGPRGPHQGHERPGGQPRRVRPVRLLRHPGEAGPHQHAIQAHPGSVVEPEP
jgi:hypothetical protein